MEIKDGKEIPASDKVGQVKTNLKLFKAESKWVS